MASFLLDTHSFIWYFEENNQLSRTADALIRDGENRIYISIASLWEMVIKINIGKLHLKLSIDEVSEFCLENNVSFLSLSLPHLNAYM